MGTQSSETRVARKLQKLSDAGYTTCLQAVRTKVEALVAAGQAEHAGVAYAACRRAIEAGDLAYFNLKKEKGP